MATQEKYSPRTYGNRTNNTWTETVCDANGANCSTDTYYITVKDPGDGGPKIPFVGGASGELAGEATVYKRNDGFIGWLTGQSGDEVIGIIPAYGDDKGKLINKAPFRSAELERRISHFSNPKNLNRVKNQAILTTQKGMLANKDVYGVDIEPVTTDPKVAQTKAEKLRNTGTAMPNEESDTNTNTDTSSTPIEQADNNKVIEGTRETFSQNLQYPETLSKTQDRIKIQMLKYIARGLNSTKARKGLGEEMDNGQIREAIGTVILPIPGGIKDSDNVNWGENSMNSLYMAAAQFAEGTITEGPEGAKNELVAINERFKENQGKLKEAVGTAFAAAAIGKDFRTLMQRQEGQVLNPNMELLFDGPTLRPFTFNFLLAPRSKSESLMVMKIIRFFKQGMAPIRSAGHLFLRSPHTFQLTYQNGEEKTHKYLNSFKECALKNCEVNYTPEQTYSTYEDGVMTAYTMSLSFQELEPVFNDDYGKEDVENLNFSETSSSSLTGGSEWSLIGDYSGLGGGPGQAPR